MFKPFITFLTATYNRAKTLPKLYESIKQQHERVIWFVVDDGSNDNTEKLIKEWSGEPSTVTIKYIKKENGGKHRALNLAIPLLTTPLVMVIDSDDYLTYDCLSIIKKNWMIYKKTPKLGSLIFERGISNKEKPMVKIKHNTIAPRFEYIEKNRLYGDYSDVFITKVLQEFRFPEFPGENFISEGPLYYEFSAKYNSVFIGEVISIGNYQGGGLTNNSRRLKLKNYHGALYDLKQSISLRGSWYGCIKHAILYDYIAIACPIPLSNSIRDSEHIILTSIFLPLGLIFYLKDILITKNS